MSSDHSDLDFGATIRGLAPGQKLFGRYTLKKVLGRGGMGIVWLARDESLERDIAIKMLPEVVASDPSAVRDLKRETSRSQQLSHPYILRIFDFVEAGQHCGITMEVIEGGTLTAKRLEAPGEVLAVAQLSGWVRQMCDGLDYAHQEVGIVHRDLKPANLMLDGRGRLKITDFGIARSITDSVSRVSRMSTGDGSLPYMSPQQLSGEKPAVSDDIYALGSTLYELLTGKPPFYSGGMAAIMHQVQSKVPPSLELRRKDLGVVGEVIPSAWEETIAACLAKDAATRPQSAGEIAERLGLVRSGSGSKQPKSAGAKTASKAEAPEPKSGAASAAEPKLKAIKPAPEKKSRMGLYVGIAAALIGLVGGGYYFGVYKPEQTRKAELVRLEQEAKQAADEKEKARLVAEAAAARQAADEAAAKVAAAAKAQEAAENKAYREIVAKIESVADGTTAALRESTAGAVTNYTGSAPLKYRGEVETQWKQRLAGWEAARLAAARGGIIVKTEPAGAEVTVGALEHGVSPVTVKDAKLGRYPVKAKLTGYEEYSGEVEVKENEFSEVNAKLVRSTGSVAITSEPSGLSYELSSSGEKTERGTTPATLVKIPTGDYTLTVTRSGWPEVRQTVKVERGVEAKGQAAFIGGNLEVTSEPSGAEVYGSGKKLGVTPLSFKELPPSDFEFEFRLQGYKSAGVRGEVKAKETARASVKLEGAQFAISDLGLKMVPIAAGTFMMGSENGDNDEKPITRVTLTRPYWLGATEVTQAQYLAVMGTNPARFKGDNLPVERVSWEEAMEFCRKMTDRERAGGMLPSGYAYTLPTEAQWEYACRAGTTGDYGGDLDVLGWSKQNSGSMPHPVGTKKANGWGLFDMHGSVWEWCSDWRGAYPGGSVTDPKGAAGGPYRVSRGGSWFFDASFCRSSYRFRNDLGFRSHFFGFRLALSSVP